MKPLILTSRAEIRAGASKTPKVSILAYSGGLMRVPAWGPVVLDTAGMQFADSITLLADHVSNLDGIVGAGRGSVARGSVMVDGVLARSSEAAMKIIELSKAGVEFQASVGADPIQTASVTSANVNGRTIQSKTPFTLIQKSLLREVSITALGADPTTSVAIAARKRVANMAKRRSQPVVTEPEELEIDTPGTDDDAILAERERMKAFCAIAVKYPDMRAEALTDLQSQAIDEEWDVNKFELELIRASRPPAGGGISRVALKQHMPYSNVASRGRAPIHAGGNKELLTAALMIHSGRAEAAAKAFGEQTAEQASMMRCHSMLDICARALQIDARDVPHDTNEMIKAAFSTSSLPNALGNLADKIAADAYTESPGAWRSIVRRRPVNNFREAKIIRMIFVGNFEDVPNGGEIQHGSLEDDAIAVQAETKGLMLGITRQDIINDDLGLFNDTAAALGKADARTKNTDFVTMLLANDGDFFGSGHNNLGDSGDTRLSATSLGAAIAAMRKQRDTKNRNLDIMPKILLIPPELEEVGRLLISSTVMQRFVDANTDQQPMGNAFQNQFQLEVEARLSNSDAFADASATAWYLFGAPSDGAVNVALLQGRETPVIEQEPAPFNTLGVQYRGYSDYGFSFGEYVAAYKAEGTNES